MSPMENSWQGDEETRLDDGDQLVRIVEVLVREDSGLDEASGSDYG